MLKGLGNLAQHQSMACRRGQIQLATWRQAR